MIDHVSVAVSDLDDGTRFDEAVLGVIGYRKLEIRGRTVGFGKEYPEFWINLRTTMAPVPEDCGAHVGLRARSTLWIREGLSEAIRPPTTPGRQPHGRTLQEQNGAD